MRRLLVLFFLLLGGLQVSQSFAAVLPAGSSTCRHSLSESRHAAPHACCPDYGLHTCCLDAGTAPLHSADSKVSSLWCGRTDCAALLKCGLFHSRGESPLIRPPIP